MKKTYLELIDSLDQPSKDRFVRQIATYKTECGCKLGGILSISALIICILYSLLSFNPISVWAGIKRLSWSAIVIVAAGLVGKGIGVGVARIKLMALYLKLLRLHH